MRPRVAVVGCGRWGLNLARVLHAQGALAAICDRDETTRTKLVARFPETPLFADLAELLPDPSLQGVVIATPPASHVELARQAVAAGKDVFVEKPLALEAAHARLLAEEARRADRLVMVGHLLLYHPALLKLQAMMAAGELGKLFYLHAQRVNLGQVRRDENAMWSLAPHDIAVARFLFEEEPTSVQAVGASFLQPDPPIDDVVFLTLRFASGRMAHLHVSWLDPNKIRRLKVVGSRKMAVFDDMATTEKLVIYDKGVVEGYEPGHYESYGDALTLRTGDILIPQIDMTEPLKLELTHFLTCLETRQKPRSDAADGLAVLRVLQAAERSLRAGGLPFELEA